MNGFLLLVRIRSDHSIHSSVPSRNHGQASRRSLCVRVTGRAGLQLQQGKEDLILSTLSTLAGCDNTMSPKARMHGSVLLDGYKTETIWSRRQLVSRFDGTVSRQGHLE